MRRVLTVVRELRERMDIRLPALLMVLGCSALCLVLWRQRHREFAGKAVTDAPVAVLMAHDAALVQTSLVSVGTRVREGQPLLTLHAGQLSAERRGVDARIQQTARSAELARLTLLQGLKQSQRDEALALLSAQREADLARAERERRGQEASAAAAMNEETERLHKAGLIDPYKAREQAALNTEKSSQSVESETRDAVESRHLFTLRKQLGALGVADELLTANERMYAAEVEVLMRERDELDARIAALTVRAPQAGLVAEIIAQGSTVQPGTVLARVAPPVAEDVVLYTSVREGLPSLTGELAYTVTLEDGRECSGLGRARSGSEATLKPVQLAGFAGLDSMGFPLRMALPAGCSLPIGQVVDLSLKAR